jgi:beta-glucosidase
MPDLLNISCKEKKWHQDATNKELPIIQIQASSLQTVTVTYEKESCNLAGEAGRIVEALSTEQLVAMSSGEVATIGDAVGASGTTVPGAAAETPKVATDELWNLASIVLADGPAGLRLKKQYEVIDGVVQAGNIMEALEGGYFAEEKEVKGELYYQYATAIPVGTLLAQTWNTELITEVGEMVGTEMEEFMVTLWLAPGMNIHRNPLCGRNFEYYSEDPLLSGMMAAAMTAGVQRQPGCGTTIKHYACNNQEDNRLNSDSVVSERALREIYLKGFEIAIESSQPMAIMTSYNMINGIHAANSYDLCTKLARDEWGFAGVIMTDWTTTNNTKNGISTASGCMRAQNDMIMPGFQEDHDNIRKELDEGSLKLEELKRCVYHTVRIILQSNRYEGAVSYTKQFDNLKSYINLKRS